MDANDKTKEGLTWIPLGSGFSDKDKEAHISINVPVSREKS